MSCSQVGTQTICNTVPQRVVVCDRRATDDDNNQDEGGAL